MEKSKIAVLVPCYNESKTIKKVVEDFNSFKKSFGNNPHFIGTL